MQNAVLAASLRGLRRAEIVRRGLGRLLRRVGLPLPADPGFTPEEIDRTARILAAIRPGDEVGDRLVDGALARIARDAGVTELQVSAVHYQLLLARRQGLLPR